FRQYNTSVVSTRHAHRMNVRYFWFFLFNSKSLTSRRKTKTIGAHLLWPIGSDQYTTVKGPSSISLLDRYERARPAVELPIRNHSNWRGRFYRIPFAIHNYGGQ